MGTKRTAKMLLSTALWIVGCETQRGSPDAAIDAGTPSRAETSTPDAVADDAVDVPSVPARDGAVNRCDPGAHVDCFWSPPTCADGVVTIPINAPIPYCTNEEARAAYFRGVCSERAARRPCPSGRCATLNPRFAACVARYDPQAPWSEALCEGTVRGEGDSCTTGQRCFLPALDPDAALRCDADAGRCVRTARSTDGGTVGTACGDDADCPRDTVCAQDRTCRWRCTAVTDGGLAAEATDDG